MDEPGRFREVSPAYRPASGQLTYDDYRRLPSRPRYELIEGDLSMPPSPNTVHQRVTLRLAMALSSWVGEHKLGEVFVAPYDVVLGSRTVLQPDVVFVSSARMSIVTPANVQGVPDLVVEVLSPHDEDRDQIVKRDVYAKYGVGEYWVVDPARKTIEVMVLSGHEFGTPSVYGMDDVLKSVILPGLEMQVTGALTGI